MVLKYSCVFYDKAKKPNVEIINDSHDEQIACTNL